MRYFNHRFVTGRTEEVNGATDGNNLILKRFRCCIGQGAISKPAGGPRGPILAHDTLIGGSVGTDRVAAMISAAGFPLPERQKIGVSRRGLGGNHVPAAVIVLCDLLAVLIAGAASLVILKADGGGSLARTIEPQVVIPWVGLCAWLAACRLYGGHKPLPVEAACIAWGSLILALVTVLLLHHQERVGLVVLLPYVLAPLLLMLFRYVARRLLYRSGAWSVPTVAIGPLRQCAGIGETLSKDWYRGFAVRAIIPLDEANRASVADRVATWA